MKIPGLSMCALFAGCVAIAACSQDKELSRFQYAPVVNTIRDTVAGYGVLYSFLAAPDGVHPFASLIYAKGTLYGTTGLGGANGLGTVYKMTLGGQENVIYSFKGGTDGCTPFAGLVVLTNLLYGATFGSSSCSSNGTIFRVASNGAETTVHAFASGKDGANPYGGLVVVGGKLYGTTQNAGLHNAGTVFSITP